MVRFADKKKVLEPLLLESEKPSRYKKEEKKPWILAYYALMSGTAKRQARLAAKPLAFGVKEREAAKARRELELENFQPIILDPRHLIKPPEDIGPEPNANQTD